MLGRWIRVGTQQFGLWLLIWAVWFGLWLNLWLSRSDLEELLERRWSGCLSMCWG